MWLEKILVSLERKLKEKILEITKKDNASNNDINNDNEKSSNDNNSNINDYVRRRLP